MTNDQLYTLIRETTVEILANEDESSMRDKIDGLQHILTEFYKRAIITHN